MADIVSCLTQPAKVAVTWIGEQIFQQFNFLWCFTTNINSLREEEKRLDDATKGLQLDADKAKENDEVIYPEVETWLEKSKAIKDETSKILSEATNVESDHLKLGDRLSLSKRAKETTDRIKEHRGQKIFDSISTPGPPPATLTVPEETTLEFKSRKIIEDTIMSTLRDRRDVNMIGIYGMGGLGKTTMAERIRNRVLIKNVFQEAAMTTVSQQVDKSKIQVEIGGQLGLKKLEEETSLGRELKLDARLRGTKRTLVILDDVWQGLELKELGIPCDSKWCTILITSRDRDALGAMGCKVENKFGMEILSEEEAWCLFREGAGTCVDDPNLNSIAKDVVKECKGLPIALKTLGLALKDKTNASIWNDSLRELRQCDADIPNYIKEVYTPLKWSYDFLDSDNAKSLFLLCCLFPEDSNIPLENLTYFCMGLGKFGRIRNLEDARDKTCSLTDNLKSRSLLLDGYNQNHVRMHDVVRDVCTFIAKEKGYIGGNDCSWISSSQFDGETNELLTESRSPNLRLLSLKLSKGEVFSSAFLEGIKDLYVLCIEDDWVSGGLTSLPHTTQSLINLKTLLLVKCGKLKSISVVGKLRNLEILICRKCELIEELPPEMEGLDRLKLLELTDCRKLQSIGRGIISSLVALEELKMHHSFNRWEADDREERGNAGLKELQALKKLRCLEIDIGDPSLVSINMPRLSKKIVEFVIGIGTTTYYTLPSKFRKAMSLCLERESRLGDWIEMLYLRDVECLELKGDAGNIVDLAKSEKCIRWLKLRECESMKNVVRTSRGDDATVFPLIEHLELEYLPQLREICHGQISTTSFSNLSYIYIHRCDSLRNLGQLSVAGKDCLLHLEELHVWECEMMEQVFLWNSEEVITKVFPKLKSIWLCNLPNLTSFYQGIQGIEFPLLREVKIEKCPNMESLSMGLVATPNFEAFKTDLATYVGLGVDVAFECLKELEISRNENPMYDDKISVSLFSGLAKLRLVSYTGSMCLFSSSAVGNLVNLTVLEIKYCGEIVKVIEDEDGKVGSGGEIRSSVVVFPKLQELYLEELPNFVRFCEWKCDVELPSLREVSIIDCYNMENFSMGSVAAPKLEIVQIDKEEIGGTKDLNGALQQHYLAHPEKRSEDYLAWRILEKFREIWD